MKYYWYCSLSVYGCRCKGKCTKPYEDKNKAAIAARKHERLLGHRGKTRITRGEPYFMR